MSNGVALELLRICYGLLMGAIRSDFILSAEIIVIALGIVKDASIMMQIIVVCANAAIMAVSVYALVAAIVKHRGCWFSTY